MISPHDALARVMEAGLSPPESMTLMVTGQCNLQCHHCWLDCRPGSSFPAVPRDSIFRILEEMSRLNIKRVQLTGGEILTHSHWLEILSFSCHHTDLDEVCMQTNAMLLTPDSIERIRRLPREKLVIQVSLDGVAAASHDRVRGAGSFDLAMAGLNLLVVAGLGSQVRVAFTELAHNCDELPGLLEALDRMGIGRLVSGTLIKDGRAAGAAGLSLPSPSQYRRLVSRYTDDPLFRERYERMASISAIEWFKGRSGGGEGACACIQHLFGRWDGLLFPCAMMLHEAYAVGDLHERDFTGLLVEGIPLWRELSRMHRLRRQALEDCGTCEGRRHCGGGCMGRAFAVYGDLLQREDRCSLRQAVYGHPCR
jgi:radical SAM protein with 4Fe4S-binding SPASM domain